MRIEGTANIRKSKAAIQQIILAEAVEVLDSVRWWKVWQDKVANAFKADEKVRAAQGQYLMQTAFNIYVFA